MSDDNNSDNWREVTLDLEQSPTKVKYSRSIIRNDKMIQSFLLLEPSPTKKRAREKKPEVSTFNSCLDCFVTNSQICQHK